MILFLERKDRLIFGRLVGEIFLYHKRYLEGHRVIKFAKVKAGELSDLLKTVNQGITVYEQLSRGLGNVKIVLEDALTGALHSL